MGTLSHLGHAAQLIRDADPERAFQWILYALHKELKIKPGNHKDPEDYVITVLTRVELEKGLTSKRWNEIDGRLRTAILKGSLK